MKVFVHIIKDIDYVMAAKEAQESRTSAELPQTAYCTIHSHLSRTDSSPSPRENTSRYHCVSMRLAVRVSLNKAISMTTLRPDIDQLSDQSVRPELTVPSDDTNKKGKARYDEPEGEHNHQQQRACCNPTEVGCKEF